MRSPLQFLEDTLKKARNDHWDSEAQAAAGKSVVLVEGDDDRLVIEAALKARRPSALNRVAVVPMGGRDKVLEALAGEVVAPGAAKGARFQEASVGVFAIVDRDVWTHEEVIARRAANHNRLFVTEGWCMENHLFDPDVLRGVVAEVLPDSTEADLALRSILTELESLRVGWVQAGAFWRVLQGRRDHLHEGLNQIFGERKYGARLDFDALEASAWPQNIVARLGAFDGAPFDPAALHKAIAEQARTDGMLAPEQQWLTAVHGKQAFRLTLQETLKKTLKSRREKEQWLEILGRLIHRRTPFVELFSLLLP